MTVKQFIQSTIFCKDLAHMSAVELIYFRYISLCVHIHASAWAHIHTTCTECLVSVCATAVFKLLQVSNNVSSSHCSFWDFTFPSHCDITVTRYMCFGIMHLIIIFPLSWNLLIEITSLLLIQDFINIDDCCCCDSFHFLNTCSAYIQMEAACISWDAIYISLTG